MHYIFVDDNNDDRLLLQATESTRV